MIRDSGRLADKVALISGGASGIGKATAVRFFKEGAKVAITDINETIGKETAEKLGYDCIFLFQDVTREQEWYRVIDTTMETYGRLDILVNSAGILFKGTIEDTTFEDWRRVLDINLEGTFLGCKAAIKAMHRFGGGSIVNLSSISGLVGDPDMAAYDASKGGVRLLTKSVALHCARMGYNIRCNSVHPGIIDTPMIGDFIDQLPNPVATQKEWISEQVIGRLGKSEEVAGLILYLASDESGFVTGSEFSIDGGYTAH